MAGNQSRLVFALAVVHARCFVAILSSHPRSKAEATLFSFLLGFTASPKFTPACLGGSLRGCHIHCVTKLVLLQTRSSAWSTMAFLRIGVSNCISFFDTSDDPGTIILRTTIGRVFNLKAAPRECYCLPASSESIVHEKPSTIEKLRKESRIDTLGKRSGLRARLEHRNTIKFRACTRACAPCWYRARTTRMTRCDPLGEACKVTLRSLHSLMVSATFAPKRRNAKRVHLGTSQKPQAAARPESPRQYLRPTRRNLQNRSRK
jgi:hypothetical protein